MAWLIGFLILGAIIFSPHITGCIVVDAAGIIFFGGLIVAGFFVLLIIFALLQ